MRPIYVVIQWDIGVYIARITPHFEYITDYIFFFIIPDSIFDLVLPFL